MLETFQNISGHGNRAVDDVREHGNSEHVIESDSRATAVDMTQTRQSYDDVFYLATL